MLIVIVVFVLGLRLWLPFMNDVQTAVRFEVRLAGQNPFPGLKEAKAGGGGRSVYLHQEVIVANSDIARAKAIPQPGGSQYSIPVAFDPAGARKAHAATEKPIGNQTAILIDGKVVAAPTVREATDASEKMVAEMRRR